MTTTYQKEKNYMGFKDYHIKDVKNMNYLMMGGNQLVRQTQQKVFYVENINKIYKQAETFSLYKHVEEIEYVDQNRAKKQANGFYTAYFKPLFPNIDIPKEQYKCEGGLFWSNEETDGKHWHGVYAYDKNSAYLSILKDGIYPDVESGDLGPGFVTADCVGYEKNFETIVLLEEGDWADIRFKKAFSPKLKKWANDIYARLGLLKAAGKEGDNEKRWEADMLKQAIVACIGTIRNHNIWFYSYIVGTCRHLMEELIDEDTLICNTDSIISKRKRDDLDIGNKLGQFKVEYEDISCYHNSTNYKLYKEKEVYKIVQRGKKKAEVTEETVEDSSQGHIADYIFNTSILGDFIYGKEKEEKDALWR